MAGMINDQVRDQQEQQNAAAADVVDSSLKCGEDENVGQGEEEEDEEEEEDVDFNPFLKGTPSPEASSSLSSDVEVLDGSPSKLSGEVVQNYNVGDSDHGEEVVMKNDVLPQSEKVEDLGHRKSKKRKVAECDDGEKDKSVLNCGINSDEEDAICKRTRARYSLASFTLDELETFLQETDDEDDLQHVDDEEEYRKFLAAVLQGGDCDGQSAQENEMADDDEDNDADFEIELEEFLDSDVDDSVKDNDRQEECERAGRRPETRQNRRHKASAEYKKKLLEQSKRPLRPIVPIFTNGTVASLPTVSGRALMPPIAPSYLSSSVNEGLVNGFTLHQIGQLHCLIHEHVQLLIQVYSLCVLDPTRKHIASQTKDMILEMLKKRDEAVTSRRMQYPDICFRPPFVCPSVVDDFYGFHPAECSVGSSMADISISNGRDMHSSTEEMSSSQTVGFLWVPLIHSPVMSILDVAPLGLARTYINDVYNAVQKYRQRHVSSDSDTIYEKEQLFHLPCNPPFSGSNGESARQNTSPSSSSPLSPQPQQPPKKTLAASIVESVKKQSVALVPKDISRLAQRFFSMFNPALYPHKPPPSSVANRVLFTDSEDELLALGMLEYNTDWKSIQQRFLPCKSTHQIFVRQKNRCSSKAPENPIKAVRRMKTSPLSAQEIECIEEGLKVYKLDWMSIWRFVVPHRDPSLLPRQWRIAVGSQKSYKFDAAAKEKRRLYEAKRRRAKAAQNWQVSSEKEDNQAECTGGENVSGDDYVDNNANEAYVHQAFLADWRPGTSNLIPPETRFSDLGGKDLPIGQPNGYSTGATNMQRIPYIFNYQHRPGASNSTALRSCWPHRTRGANLVKLAPELPPVNLPPSVRVISRPSFKSNQSAVCTARAGNGGKGNVAPQLPHLARSSPTDSAKTKVDASNQVAEATAGEDSRIVQETTIGEERGSDSDLQLHPLLFRAPEDGPLPYYPLHQSAGNSGSFSFFSGNQPLLNLSLFHNPHQSHHLSESSNKLSKSKDSAATTCGIDFHPLLQRSDEENTEGNTALGGKSSQFRNPPIASQNRGLSGQLATASKRVILLEKSNELDLEIHLSSRSSKEKTRGRRDTDANIQLSAAATKRTGNMKDVHKTDSSFYQNSEKCAKHHSETVSDIDASAFPSNDVSIVDDIGDQSHHEIVMEQEELSDSDEDFEENVEFECEEMTDSEGEDGSGCETVPDAQEQDIPSSYRNESVDHGDPQCEWQSPDHPQGNDSVPRIGTPTFLKLGLTCLDKDASNSSWLSLDSCAPVDSPKDKAKHQEGIPDDEAHTAKKLASGRPNRTSKKAAQNMKGLAAENDVIDMAQQLSLGPLASSALKRPRKRSSRINSSIQTTTEDSKTDHQVQNS